MLLSRLFVGYMRGRLSLSLDLKEYNPEIECSLNWIRAKKCEHKKKIAKEHNPPTKQRKEYFTPSTYDSPIRIRILTITGQFEIKYSLIQMLPLFHGLKSENPCKHVDACLEIYYPMCFE